VVAPEWKQTISKHMRYKKPHLVYGAKTRPDCWQKLFVTPTFLTVGKHQFIIKFNGKYHLHTTVTDIRSEEIPPCK